MNFLNMAHPSPLAHAYTQNVDLLPTLILRHRKENLKKCSLRGLESRPDFHFVTYPCDLFPSLKGYCLLTIDAPILSQEDRDLSLFLIDGTWRYAQHIKQAIDRHSQCIKRQIPAHFRTAYPRYQTGCPLPLQGLASVEALYIAFYLTGRSCAGLLDNYFWKEQFLAINPTLHGNMPQ